jgi:hypothetical protein
MPLNWMNPKDSTRAMILFTAGEEDSVPTALDVLPAIKSAGTYVFTMGFPGSRGQDALSQVAAQTGGVFFASADSAQIGPIVTQIWNLLTGQQFVFAVRFLELGHLRRRRIARFGAEIVV